MEQVKKERESGDREGESREGKEQDKRRRQEKVKGRNKSSSAKINSRGLVWLEILQKILESVNLY